MSGGTFTLPPLLDSGGQLTDAGAQLVKFANARVNQQRREDMFDKFTGDCYRNWYAATMTSKAVMTPEQYIAAYYAKSNEADSIAAIWLDYLNTLTPEGRARAQIVPPNSTPTKESTMSEHTEVTRLVESITPGLQELKAEVGKSGKKRLTLTEGLQSERHFKRFEYEQAEAFVEGFIEKAYRNDGSPNWPFILESPEYLEIYKTIEARR